MLLDQALEEIGVCGYFPLVVFLLYNVIIPTIQPWQILANQYVLRAPDNFSCGGEVAEGFTPGNFTPDDECFRCVSKNGSWDATYEDEHMNGTLVPRWNLICNRQGLIPLSTSLYFVGVFLASFLTGPLIDRYGRKWFALGCQWAMSVMSLVIAFMPLFELYALFRVLIGFFAFGSLMPCFIYGCEIVPASFRVVTGSLTNFCWGVGTMIFALIGYSFRDNAQLLLVVISLPGFFTVPLAFITPESLFWQLANGKREKAEKYLQSVAAKRGMDLARFPDGFLEAEEQHIVETRKKNASDGVTWKEIARSRMLLKHLLIMSYAWIINSMFFYGLSYSSTTLAGSPYLNLFYSGLAETLAYATMIPVLKYLGRRRPIFAFHLLAGAFLILVPVVRYLATDPTKAVLFLNMAGKFCITFTFASAWLLSGEVAPTSCRTTFFSICECASRIGAFAAPYTLLLADHTHKAVPEVLYGMTSVFAAFLIVLLPETNNYPMPSTKDAIRRMYKGLPPLAENQENEEDSKNSEM